MSEQITEGCSISPNSSSSQELLSTRGEKPTHMPSTDFYDRSKLADETFQKVTIKRIDKYYAHLLLAIYQMAVKSINRRNASA